jgi:phage baseplate assembly protein W
MASITPLTRRSEIHSDFHKDLALLPGRNDIARRVNENSVKEAIKNILLTDRGERLFQPLVGSDIRALLFENVSPVTSIIMRDRIQSALEAYEPRCGLKDVEVLGDIDSNSVRINVVFYVINNETPQTLSIDIDRVR